MAALQQAKYSKISESLRKMTPSETLCPLFCGGRKCKYDSANCWNTTDMAIDGIYSHWVTNNILAMARPNSEIIQRKNIITQFNKLGIKSIINLQMPGEHSHCGPPLEPSGFSYLPDIFMENQIFFYNFGWKDYGESTLQGLLDAVKVTAFALSQGKIAVHCHAGLGRTGVLLACYLVYASRIEADEAIRHVRQKRPNAVQTRGQIMIVYEFEHFLKPFTNIFALRSKVKKSEKKRYSAAFTLTRHLDDQKIVLHGHEARALRYIPKIVYVICERLLILCRANVDTLNYDLDERQLPFTRFFFVTQFDRENERRLPYKKEIHQQLIELSPVADRRGQSDNSLVEKSINTNHLEGKFQDMLVIEGIDGKQWTATQDDVNNANIEELGFQMNIRSALICDPSHLSLDDVMSSILANPNEPCEATISEAVVNYSFRLNGCVSTWVRLASEKRPQVLVQLLWHWLLHLKQPLLTNHELCHIVCHASEPQICLSKFDQGTRYTFEYLLRFILRLSKDGNSVVHPQLPNILRRFAGVLTQQDVVIDGSVYSATCGKRKSLGKGTLSHLLLFMRNAMHCFNPPTESNQSYSKQEMIE